MSESPQRCRLPNRRASESFNLESQGLRFTCTASRFADGSLAEVFLQNHKCGSMAAINAQDSAVVCSIALQYGVPLMIEHINAIVFDGDSTAVNIRTHIGQINDALTETNIRIRGDNPRGFYRIARADVSRRETHRRPPADLSPKQSEPS